MSLEKEQAQRLLALYSSGQISAQEKNELFAASLEDQELFEALAHEDALRDVMALPGARERVIAVLAPSQKSRWFAWAGGLAVAAAAVIVVIAIRQQPSPLAPEKPVEVAVQTAPPAEEPKRSSQALTAPVLKDKIARSEPASVERRAMQFSLPAPVLNGKTPLASAPPEIRAMQLPVPPVDVIAERAAGTIAPAQEADKAKKEVMDSAANRAIVAMAAPPPPSPPVAIARGGAPPLGQVRQGIVASEDAMMIASTQPAYTVLRRDAEGLFAALQPGQKLKRGDVIRVSVLAQATGNMTVEFGGNNETLPVNMGIPYVVPRTSEIILNEASGESVVRIRYAGGRPLLRAAQKAKSAPAIAAVPAAPAPASSLEIRLKYE